MKYKTGDLLRHKKTGEIRMVEGTRIGIPNQPTTWRKGYVVWVSFCPTLWQTRDVELLVDAKTLRERANNGKQIYANDNKNLVKFIENNY